MLKMTVHIHSVLSSHSQCTSVPTAAEFQPYFHMIDVDVDQRDIIEWLESDSTEGTNT